MMQIGIVCYPTFGGSGVVATELGLELSRRGHEVHFITYSQPVRLELLSANVFFHEVNVPEYTLFHYQPYELALSSKIVDMVRKHKIQLLHVHYAIPHAYAAYMAKSMLKEYDINLPVVTTLHGTDITLVGKHPFYKTAVTFSINQSDAVTSVSENLKADTLKIFNTNKQIEVIPNFIDTTKQNVTLVNCQRSFMADANEMILTHISNFRKVKRISDVISIFNLVLQKIPSKLVMVGDGPERLNAELQAKDLGIMDKIIFLGNSNEIDKILCMSDLFLLPSETESFGLAALEAMAFSVPVISSNTGGIPEVNIHGKSGFLSPVGDVRSMANHAIQILSNSELLEIFKKNAKSISNAFDIHKIVPRYEALYASVLNQNG